MITSLTFIRNNHPPVLWQDLKPGDWFVFEPTITCEPWLMLDTALVGAVHLRTGRTQFFGRLDDTQLWRVQAQVTLTARPPV